MPRTKKEKPTAAEPLISGQIGGVPIAQIVADKTMPKQAEPLALVSAEEADVDDITACSEEELRGVARYLVDGKTMTEKASEWWAEHSATTDFEVEDKDLAPQWQMVQRFRRWAAGYQFLIASVFEEFDGNVNILVQQIFVQPEVKKLMEAIATIAGVKYEMNMWIPATCVDTIIAELSKTFLPCDMTQAKPSVDATIEEINTWKGLLHDKFEGVVPPADMPCDTTLPVPESEIPVTFEV